MDTIKRGVQDLQSILNDPGFLRPMRDGQHRIRKPLPTPLRRAVLLRDRFRCNECSLEAHSEVSMQVDHVVPVAAGGTDRTDNLRTLCEPCNQEKSNLLTIGVRAVKPRLIVAYCLRDIPVVDFEAETLAVQVVFCALCKARRSVDAVHAAKYEFSGYLARHYPDLE